MNCKRLVTAFLLSILAAGLVACGGGGGDAPAPAATITAQPTDQGVVEGSSANFSVTAGAATGYQWQRSTDGGSTFAPLAGATGSTYTTPATALADSGQQFRVVVSGAGGNATSSAATLTVTAAAVAPSISVQPANQSVTEGQNAQFTVTASGTTLSYQWQVSTDGGTTFNNATGADASTATLTRAAVALADDGQRFRVVVSNTLGTVTSNAATLVVTPAPVAPAFSTQPTSTSVVEGQSAGFVVVITGTPAPTVQWQTSTNGGGTWADVPSATAAAFAFGPTTLADNGRQFRAVATNGTGSLASNAATLTVTPAPVAPGFSTQPAASVSVLERQNAALTVAATGTPTPTLQWQLSTDGGTTWNNINGATDARLDIVRPALADNGRRYRALASNASGTATSNVAVLTVTAVVPRFAFVADRGAGSITSYALDSSTGRLKFVGRVGTGSTPLSVTLEPSGRYAYAVDSFSSFVVQFTVGADGRLTPMVPDFVATGTTPLSITVDPSGRYAYVANSGDNTVSQYLVSAGGGLTPMPSSTVPAGTKPSAVVVDAAGRFAYVANQDSNNVSQYRIGTGGELTPLASATVAAGAGATAMAIDPTGRYAYVANKLAGNVSQYAIGADGSLTPMSTATVAAGAGASALAIDPTGLRLYVVNLGGDTVSQYDIGVGGALAPMASATVAAAGNPVGISIDPSGLYAYVSTSGLGHVLQYTIGGGGGLVANAPSAVAGGSSISSVAISGGSAALQLVPKFAYVTSSDGNGVGDDVRQYAIGAGGTLTPLAAPSVSAGASANAIALAVEPGGRFAYVANFNTNNIAQYAVGTNGALTPLATATVASTDNPTAIAIHPSGRFLYTANFAGSYVLQYNIGSNGSLTPIGNTVIPVGGSPYSITIDPSGRYAYVANRGTDTVSQFTISNFGVLTAMTPATVATGSSPQSVTVDPSGRYVYVANGTSADVSQYVIGAGGALTPMATATVAAGTNAFAVAVDPLGLYAYVVNRDAANVSQYAIGAGGALSALTPATVALSASPALPNDVGIDPTGKYVYVPDTFNINNNVSLYTIGAGGALAPQTPATVGAGVSARNVVTTGAYQ